MRTVIKTIITTVLLSTLLAPLSNVEARLKYYRYNNNIPMVEMSLNMMVAMGVLEPIPSRLVHDGNPYNRLVRARSGRYSRSPYTYAGYSSRSRYYDDYWDEPASPYRRYSRSRYDYLSDPWDRYRGDYRYSPKYSSWYGPWADRWSSPWYSGWDSPWDTAGYDRWKNPWSNPWYGGGMSPWGSAWSSQWMNPWYSPYGYLGGLPFTQGYTGLPILPDSLLGDDTSRIKPYPSDEPSQQIEKKNGFKAQETSWSTRPSRAGYSRNNHRTGNNRNYQQLNGLWIDDNGEILGIRGNRFLWYDNNRYAKGQLIKSPTMMEARIRETKTVIRFHYKQHNNEMVIVSRDGKTRTFNRMPLILSHNSSAKPRAANSSYSPNADNLHVRHSRYQTRTVKPQLKTRPGSSKPAMTPRSDKTTFAPRMTGYNRSSTIKLTPVSYRQNREPVGLAKTSVSTAVGGTEGAASRGMSPDSGPVANNVAPEHNKSATVTDKEQVPASAYPEGTDLNDPNTYLYSYLNDAEGGDASGSEDAENGDAVARNKRSNIWKPNELFPHRRRVSISARPEQSAKTGAAKLGWSESGPWN